MTRDRKIFSQQRFGAQEIRQPERDRRIVQVGMKGPVRPMMARAVAPSPFRFTGASEEQLAPLHELLNHHALREAHASIRRRHRGQRGRRRPQREKDLLGRFVDLHFPTGANVDAILRDLSELPEVQRAVELRGLIPANALPTDPLIGGNDQLGSDAATGLEFQWYLFCSGADRAWARVSGNGVIIADVDLGFFTDHQDLAPNIDAAHAHNSVDGSNDVAAGNDKDHGTAVLGLAGGASNALGMAGFAYGATLWPIQANAANGTALPGDAWANAVDWIVGENPGGRRVVINIEAQTGNLGNCEQLPALNAAIQAAIAKGCVVCVAGGTFAACSGGADGHRAVPVYLSGSPAGELDVRRPPTGKAVRRGWRRWSAL